MFAQLILACVIPATLSIVAPDPCAVAAEVEAAWAKEEWFRMVYDAFAQRQFTPLPLSQVSLRVVEEPEPFYVAGAPYLGYTSVTFGSYYTIRFVRSQNQRYDLLVHELRHLGAHAAERDWADYRTVGHGCPSDPLYQALATLRNWSYPVPGFEYTPSVAPSAACASSILPSRARLSRAESRDQLAVIPQSEEALCAISPGGF